MKQILFSGPMVRAILDGRKTMTRRVVKPQPIIVCGKDGNVFPLDGRPAMLCHRLTSNGENIYTKFPYGQPGDRLWVRETWQYHLCLGSSMDQEVIHYRADDPSCPIDGTWIKPWKPSIFMPRWASRITLEVVSVKVERVQDISEEDAKAEGAQPSIVGYELDYLAYRAGFKTLWDSINAKKHPWDTNPWVWRVEFKRAAEIDRLERKPHGAQNENG